MVQVARQGLLRYQAPVDDPRYKAGGVTWLVEPGARWIEERIARQELAQKLLPKGSFQAHPESYYLWLGLTEGWASNLRRKMPRSGPWLFADFAKFWRLLHESAGGSDTR